MLHKKEIGREKWSQLWECLLRVYIQKYQKRGLPKQNYEFMNLMVILTKQSRAFSTWLRYSAGVTHTTSTANNYEHNKNTARSTEQTFNCIKYSNVVASAFCSQAKTDNTLYHAQPALPPLPLPQTQHANKPCAAFYICNRLKGDEYRHLVICGLHTPLYSAPMWMCSECDITPFKFVWDGGFLCLVLAVQTVEVLCLSRRGKNKFTFQFSSW